MHFVMKTYSNLLLFILIPVPSDIGLVHFCIYVDYELIELTLSDLFSAIMHVLVYITEFWYVFWPMMLCDTESTQNLQKNVGSHDYFMSS